MDFGLAEAFLGFLFDGGVSARECSLDTTVAESEFSSSESGLARFFGFGAAFVTLDAVDLLVAALAFDVGAFAACFATGFDF
jgi:hypothetical protein